MPLSPRGRYLSDSVGTAPAGRLLTMLYDRLCLDLARGEQAIRADDRPAVGTSMTHAVEIILELRGSLDVDAWDGAVGLAALYDFLVGELLQAQLRLDADRVGTCRSLVEPLRDAWHEAFTATTTRPNVIAEAIGT